MTDTNGNGPHRRELSYTDAPALAHVLLRVTDRAGLAAYAEELRGQIELERLQFHYHSNATALSQLKLDHFMTILRAAEKRLEELT